MRFKQLLVIKQLCLTIKHSHEIQKDIDLDAYGHINYMLFLIDKMLNIYNEIYYYINKYHYKIIEIDENENVSNVELPNLLLTFTDEIENNVGLFHLDKELPKMLFDFIYSFHEIKKSMDEKISEMFKDYPKYKIENGDIIKLEEDEIANIEIQQEIFYLDISYEVLKWKDFYKTIVQLIETENYDEIILHLGVKE